MQEALLLLVIHSTIPAKACGYGSSRRIVKAGIKDQFLIPHRPRFYAVFMCDYSNVVRTLRVRGSAGGGRAHGFKYGVHQGGLQLGFHHRVLAGNGGAGFVESGDL